MNKYSAKLNKYLKSKCQKMIVLTIAKLNEFLINQSMSNCPDCPYLLFLIFWPPRNDWVTPASINPYPTFFRTIKMDLKVHLYLLERQ
jgi:hypothetical protein